jgi:serine/threonine-protein kinase
MGPGQRVGRYQILAQLGRGGMGAVYRARDEHLHREVALKVVAGNASGVTAGRVLREARAAAALVHPHIAVLHDAGEADGWLYLAMELVEGPNLRVAAATASLEQRLRWLVQVARALEAAHRAGLMHRDVKPDNVMIAPDGAAKVLDFGIAKRLDSAVPVAEGVTETAGGGVVGTPAYMAPEQIRGEAMDGRSDQFSWGVTAYEILSGTRPWKGPTTLALASVIVHEKEAPLLEQVPGLPPEVAAVVHRALEKNAARRFASMGELVEALGPRVGPPGERVSTPAVGGPDAALAPTLTLPPAPAAAPRAVQGPEAATERRAGWRMPAVVVVALLVAGSAVVLAAGWGRLAPSGQNRGMGRTRPASRNPEAARLFDEGMRLWWTHSAAESLAVWRRAMAVDPELAPALLRVALLSIPAAADLVESRQLYRRAERLLDRLEPPERALHAAAAPFFAATSDPRGFAARMADAVARFPGHAELAYWRAMASYLAGDSATAAALSEASMKTDPGFLPPHTLAWLTANNRGEDPTPLLRTCASRFPRSPHCAGQLLSLAAGGSDCEQLAKLSGEYAAAVPDHYAGYRGRAVARHALGSPPEVVDEILGRAAQRMAPTAAAIYGTLRAELAEARGDFTAALAAHQAQLAAIDGFAVDLRARVQAAIARVLEEQGQPEQARAVIADALRRQEARDVPVGLDDDDGTPELVRMAGRLGALPADELSRQRARVLGYRRSRYGQRIVRLELASTPEEARQALGEGHPPHLAVRPRGEFLHLRAQVARLAGDLPRAVALFRQSLSSCDRLLWPTQVQRARLQLGQLLEQTGQAAEAKVQYQAILATWDSARPRCITAEAARERLR